MKEQESEQSLLSSSPEHSAEETSNPESLDLFTIGEEEEEKAEGQTK